MTIQQSLKRAKTQLMNKQIDSYSLDAEILLSHLLEQSRDYLLAHPEEDLLTINKTSYQQLIQQRLDHWPVAYLIGHQEFYGLKFKVNQDVLIPRPETELIIDDILDNRFTVNKDTTILDLGTGSGCIIITLAKNLSKQTNHFLAIDISESAIQVAKTNAETHQQKIDFIIGNLLQPILDQPEIITNGIIITANLPYVPQDFSHPSTKHEPALALKGGIDGLDYYRQLAKQIQKLKEMKEIKIKLYCEIDDKQSEGIQTIFPQAKITIQKDLAKLDRLAIIDFHIHHDLQ